MLINKIRSTFNKQVQTRMEFISGIVFILLIPAIAQILYSSLGLNPTDDGFILAGSRRILDGQIPHLDFISIRPAGSHILHVPFVFLGGDYTIWISRYFVLLQYASIAWAWTIIISNSFKNFFNITYKLAFALIAFYFSVHAFPIMAWHSVDSLFFASIGIMMCHKQSNSIKMIGYFLIGMTALFRQNFFLLIPITLIIFKDWRVKRYWYIACLPLAFYIGYMALNGALSDFILQLSTYTFGSSVRRGILAYFFDRGLPWGILMGYFAIQIIYGKFSFWSTSNYTIWYRKFGILMLFSIPFISIVLLYFKGWFYATIPSFAIFGGVLGATIGLISIEKEITKLTRCGILILTVAWSVSISIGYNTPALATGPLVLFLIACGISASYSQRDIKSTSKSLHLQSSFSHLNSQNYITILLVLLLLITTIAFNNARINHIYREATAPQLIYDLGEVLPGAKMIKTNQNTYDFFKDLNVAEDYANRAGKEYVIIPDVPVNWIKSSQSNPLSVDWPQNLELGNKNMVDRAKGDLEKNRGRIIIIIQKYEAYSLALGFTPLSEGYAIVQYARSNFSKVGETQLFELYE